MSKLSKSGDSGQCSVWLVTGLSLCSKSGVTARVGWAEAKVQFGFNELERLVYVSVLIPLNSGLVFTLCKLRIRLTMLVLIPLNSGLVSAHRKVIP